MMSKLSKRVILVCTIFFGLVLSTTHPVAARALTIEDLILQNGEVNSQPPVEETGPRCEGSEVEWLACAVYFEARNQSVTGQLAVAQSILNRVRDPRWPGTIEGVIRQGEERKNGCQYSFMCDGKPERIDDLTAWSLALFVADKAMQGLTAADISCAHSYRADYVTNEKALAWFATLQTDGQVGSHIFYCGGKNA